MNSPRTWHDLEVYLPKLHRRFLRAAKERVLANWNWECFYREMHNGQLVVYIKLK